MAASSAPEMFVVAKNPDAASSLPYLVRLPIDGGEIPIVFADSRKFAEEWTYRFLATALADRGTATEPKPAQADEDRARRIL